MHDIQERATLAATGLVSDGTSTLKSCGSGGVNQCEVGLKCCDQHCAAFDLFPLFEIRQRSPSKVIGLGEVRVPVREENEMGLIFYRLIVTNGFIILLHEVLVALFIKRWLKKSPHLDAAKFFVNTIDTQVDLCPKICLMMCPKALVWLGSVVAPLLPVFGMASNVASFYVKSWLAMAVYDPPQTTCSASRTSNLQYNLTLSDISLLMVPVLTRCGFSHFVVQRLAGVCVHIPREGHLRTQFWTVYGRRLVQTVPQIAETVQGYNQMDDQSAYPLRRTLGRHFLLPSGESAQAKMAERSGSYPEGVY